MTKYSISGDDQEEMFSLGQRIAAVRPYPNYLGA